MKLTVEIVKKKILGVLRKHDVTKAALFGSVATGEATEKSDVDVLIDFKGEQSLLDLVDLKFELEELLHRKVDLLTYDSLHPLLRDKILKQQVVIL